MNNNVDLSWIFYTRCEGSEVLYSTLERVRDQRILLLQECASGEPCDLYPMSREDDCLSFYLILDELCSGDIDSELLLELELSLFKKRVLALYKNSGNWKTTINLLGLKIPALGLKKWKEWFEDIVALTKRCHRKAVVAPKRTDYMEVPFEQFPDFQNRRHLIIDGVVTIHLLDVLRFLQSLYRLQLNSVITTALAMKTRYFGSVYAPMTSLRKPLSTTPGVSKSFDDIENEIIFYPPCIQKLMSELKNGKHPHYSERMVLAQFLNKAGFGADNAIEYLRSYLFKKNPKLWNTKYSKIRQFLDGKKEYHMYSCKNVKQLLGSARCPYASPLDCACDRGIAASYYNPVNAIVPKGVEVDMTFDDLDD